MILDQCVRKGKPGSRLSDADLKDGDKWNVKRALTAALAEYLLRVDSENAAALVTYGRALLGCSLRFLLQTWSDGSQSVRVFQSCKRRWCPLCAWRKSVRNFRAAMRFLGDWLEKNPTNKFFFITLTVPNCTPEELPAMVRRMNASWRRFTDRPSFGEVCKGWIRSMEITFPRDGDCHPHFHVLLISDFRQSAWSIADLRRIWTECMQFPMTISPGGLQCNIQKVRPKDGETQSDALVRSVGQVLKYSIKPMAEIAANEWAVPTLNQLKGAKFIASGGVLRKVFVEPESEEDVKELKSSKAFSWSAGESCYRAEVGGDD